MMSLRGRYGFYRARFGDHAWTLRRLLKTVLNEWLRSARESKGLEAPPARKGELGASV